MCKTGIWPIRQASNHYVEQVSNSTKLVGNPVIRFGIFEELIGNPVQHVRYSAKLIRGAWKRLITP